MKQLRIVCWILISIFIASEFHRGVDASPPVRLWPEEDEIIIQEGERLVIECHIHGHKAVFTTETFFLGDHQQSKYETSYDEETNTYVFIRPKTVRGDTGWYACAKEGTKVRNDEQTIEHSGDDIGWIYVYVNSSQPFALDQSFEIIAAMVGKRVVLPCRTTSPKMDVLLEINFNGDYALPEGTLYDSKIGFIIPNVHSTQNGEYYSCKIRNLHNDAEETVDPLYSLSVTDPEELKKLVINEKRLRHVVWGKNLTLECSITMSSGATAYLNWTAPQHVDAWRLHTNRTDPKKEPNNKETVTVYMTVENLEATDRGEYKCYAQGSGTAEETSTTFEIWDPDNTYIDVTVDIKNNSIELPEGEKAVWKMTVDAYPENINFTWMKPDGKEVENIKPDDRNKFSYNRTDTTHIFRISQLNIGDNGNYTIHFFNERNDHKDVHLSLVVTAKPTVSIWKNSTMYRRGHPALFSCTAIASPLPNVSWSYIEYPDLPFEGNPVPRHFSGSEEKSSGFNLESVLNVTMNMTGDLICESCNSIDCTEARIRVYVSDGDLGIDGAAAVTEGDNVTLTCFASRHNFTDRILWKFENESLPKSIIPFDTGTATKSRSMLLINNATISHGGLYSCHAERRTGAVKTVYHELRVMTAEIPRITTTNLNGTKIAVKANKNNREQTLECFAEGNPTPTITWYKGKELLEENDQYHFTSNNSTLQIKLYGYEDSGKYICRAKNRLGEVERFVDMTVEGRSKPTSSTVWVSLICVLIVIIIVVITYMVVKVRREKRLRKELLDAGLTHFREGALECLNPDLTIDEQAELLPYDKKWEFPRERLSLGRQLGSGAFGVVVKAEARGICVEGEKTTVAVKMVRRSADPSYMKALSSELKIMIHLGRHLNVVNLLGACTKSILTKLELYVIVEYCRYGNLHNYLQRHRANFIDQIDPVTRKIDQKIGIELLCERVSATSPRSKYSGGPFSPSPSTKSTSGNSDILLVDYHAGSNFVDVNMSPDGDVLSNNSAQPGWRSNYRGDYKEQNLKPICTQDLLCWAWQVAQGMEYLSSKNVLHGDLAARNILLADDNIVKICDFGLAKNTYKDANYKKKGDGPLPLKWMAIESIRDRIFSTQSDVWSFGIVLWEFFTLARSPYPGMEAEKQYDRLVDGYRMEKPEYATDEIYDLMLDCWRANPSLRPSFSELVEKIGNLVNERIKMHYLELSTPYMYMNAAALENGQSDYLSMMSAPNHPYSNMNAVEVDVHPESAYVAMNRVKPSSQTGIVTPCPASEESHFNFPDVFDRTNRINSNSGNGNRTESMAETEEYKAKRVNSRELRTQFLMHSNNRVPNGDDAAYCNVPKFSGSNDFKSEDFNQATSLEENPNNVRSPINGTNSNKFFSASETNGHDRHYKNIPRQIKSPNENQKGGSHSNPSYVTMSKHNRNEKRDS